MPTEEDFNFSDTEDDLEIISILETHTKSENTAENKYAKTLPPRIQKLRDTLKKAHVPRNHGLQFLAGVELDIQRKRENALLIEQLFLEYCKNGNRTWLSPMEFISKYEEILLFYNGKRTSLSPFMKNLIQLAEAKISPHAFLRYVQNPRMGGDFNWRDWVPKHLKSLSIISDTLLELRNRSPFDKEILGTNFIKIARDICLVKYTGKPLAKFSEDVLKGQELNIYSGFWSKLKLDNSIFLHFFKKNILELLYTVSGKVGLNHLNQIMQHLPEVESKFRASFPENYILLSQDKIPRLYGKDFEKGFQDRRSKGYKFYDFIIEMESLLKILKSLLSTHSGFFTLPWITRVLVGRKDPVLADDIANLVISINDNGGKHIFIWHLRKFIHFSETARKEYIQYVIDNNGIDPDYPDIRRAFTHPDEESDNNYLLFITKSLQIPVEKLGYPKKPLSYKAIMDFHFERSPQDKEVFSKFKTELTLGKDRNWKPETIRELDLPGNTLHPLMLKSVIRGLGTNFSLGKKAENLTELYKKFPITKENPFTIVHEFEMAEKELPTIDKFQEEEVKKKVNIGLIQSVLVPFLGEEITNLEGFVPFLNRELLSIINSQDNKQSEKIAIEEEIKKTKESSTTDINLKLLEDSLKKVEKALRFITDKRKHFEEILNEFSSLKTEEKFVAMLVIAGFLGDSNPDLYEYCAYTILNRYLPEERLKNQWEFLREDIVPETFTLIQFEYLINCIDLCKNLVQNDKQIIYIITKNENKLHSLLQPYIITKSKKLTTDAIDAAIHKIFSLGKLHSEKSKWIDILENSKANLEKKTKKYALYVSKTSMDAYYGDMGGICLSGFPAEIQKDGLFVIRLVDKEEEMIVGMSLIVFTKNAVPSLKIQGYWGAFAFNPLSSLLSRLSYRNQLHLYRQFRRVLEILSLQTKIPVLIIGRDTLGIISNNHAFRELILNYETKKEDPALPVNDAMGISLYYEESCYQKALLLKFNKNFMT